MLAEKDGRPEALRRLLADVVIPSVGRASGWRLLAPDENEPPREGKPDPHLERHHFPEFCFCLSGLAEIRIAGRVQALHEGDVLIIPSGTAHSVAEFHCVTQKPAEAASRLLWMGVFPYGAVANLCESAGGQHRSTTRQLFVERHVNETAQHVLLELKHKGPQYEVMVQAGLVQSLAWICRGANTHPETELASAEPDAPSDETSLVARARRYIAQSFDSDLDLETISRAVFANKSHLCREFKHATGYTVMEFVTRVRIDAGKRLLLTTLKIGEIARLIGFEDAYYFSRVFKKATGLSPSEYRSQHAEMPAAEAGEAARRS